MHPNEQRARAGYKAFNEGDMAAVFDLLSDDVVWHSGGNNRMTGDYVGKEATFGFFAQLGQETAGSFHNDVHDLLANDVHGVALVTAKAARGDKTLDARVVHVSHWEDGKMTEFWALPENPSEFDDFWAD
ncbi:MAG TPA: nuclear transport factor 2 family protein [Acidimicrobiia bacterium]|nr:nuclear transport factor 2 family protein [Acidimicrobiia bacterium]